MADYEKATVVETTITAGMTMTAWRDTLNGRVIETGVQNAWRILLEELTSAGNTVHVWTKHNGVHTSIYALHIWNKWK